MRKHTNEQKVNGEFAVRRMSDLANAGYSGASPLDLYEIETDEGLRYDITGAEEHEGLTFEEAQKVLEGLNCWYAVQMDRTDDWGTGSWDYDEAVKMAQETGAQLIAVIQNDTCIEEIEAEDF